MKKKRPSQFPLIQFTVIVVVTVSVLLVVGFARRTAATYQVRNEEARLEAELVAAKEHHQDLQKRLEYVQSDAYVEEIARTQFKWARPGEVVVVVMATPVPAPTPPAPGQPTSDEEVIAQSSWEAWWMVFFESPPPH